MSDEHGPESSPGALNRCGNAERYIVAVCQTNQPVYHKEQRYRVEMDEDTYF